MQTDVDKAYLAGLIDGEGTITITLSERHGGKGYRQHQLLLTVGTNHQQTMEAISLLWKATITERRQPHGRKPMYILRWQNSTAGQIVQAIRPYLRIKAAQADIAIRLTQQIAERDHPGKALTREEWDEREQARLAIRRLNFSRYGMEAEEFREPGVLTCSICGNDFSEYKTRKKMFCSVECKKKANAVYNARYKAKKRLTTE